MPQMAPLNWLILFSYFIIIFFMFNIINFFFMMKMPKMKKATLKIFNINWKW